MQLKEKLTSEVGVVLKEISYKSLSEEKEPSSEIKDNYNIIHKTQKEIVILFSRELNLKISNGYNLKIEVEFRRYPCDGLNLEEILSDDIIKEHIAEICAPIMPYVSLLISQITSNFNKQPVITAPVYMNN